MRGAPKAASVWRSEIGGRRSLSDVNDSGHSGSPLVIARLVRSLDFERVLRTKIWAHSPHFAVHHLPNAPSGFAKRPARADSDELSTTAVPLPTPPVDDSSRNPSSEAPGTLWLGAVVPKRHARRAVTRSLLKRQIRAVVTGHADSLAGGLWVVRVRAPFDRRHFVSAASDELKRTARVELELLLCDAAQRFAHR